MLPRRCRFSSYANALALYKITQKLPNSPPFLLVSLSVKVRIESGIGCPLSVKKKHSLVGAKLTQMHAYTHVFKDRIDLILHHQEYPYQSPQRFQFNLWKHYLKFV